MKWGRFAEAVAESVDVIFTMVTNAAALAAITDGPDGILAASRPENFSST